VLAAGLVTGALLGALHAVICSLPARQRRRGRHRADAVRHRAGLLLGKPLIDRPRRGCRRSLGWWSESPQVRSALQINVLFLIGVVLAPISLLGVSNARAGAC
jgi:hypothetical protein